MGQSETRRHSLRAWLALLSTTALLGSACASESAVFSQGLAQNITGQGNAECVAGAAIVQEGGRRSYPCAYIMSLEPVGTEVEYEYHMSLWRGVGRGSVHVDDADGVWEVVAAEVEAALDGSPVAIDWWNSFSLAPLETYTIATTIDGCKHSDGADCTMDIPSPIGEATSVVEVTEPRPAHMT